MAAKKKPAAKPADTKDEPGFFSDYGYGNGTAIVLHDPPQKPKNAKNAKTAKNKRK